jgi:DNA-binding response OmpR family regulator
MPLSPFQKALIELAHEQEITDKKLLFVLEQRGLIEHIDGKWRIFAEAMRQFVLEQEVAGPIRESHRSNHISPAHIDTASERWEPLPLTYLEDKVYKYLRSHTGEVCEREEIKQAVWEREDHLPGNSALQKIIERIREKIEPDPNNPRYLIAVRGQGYILREDSLDASKA